MIKAFIFSGIVCLVAQIIKDNTKLTNGHITSLFVVIGSLLGFFGIYNKLLIKYKAGASVVIMSFGNGLYNTAIKDGIFNMLKGGSVGIVSSLLFAVIVTIFFKAKD